MAKVNILISKIDAKYWKCLGLEGELKDQYEQTHMIVKTMGHCKLFYIFAKA